ncbi:hypothetical protein GQ42DRAFT_82941 [Ramicandelaber brevisporus]|nr:hypothetical protein GQ42DRAFT_82941 [Ramicandelaber brevisporus]
MDIRNGISTLSLSQPTNNFDVPTELDTLKNAIERLGRENYYCSVSKKDAIVNINHDINLVKEILDNKRIGNVQEKAAEFGLIEAGARTILILDLDNELDAGEAIFKLIGDYDSLNQHNADGKRYSGIEIYYRQRCRLDIKIFNTTPSEQLAGIRCWLVMTQNLRDKLNIAASIAHSRYDECNNMESCISAYKVFQAAQSGVKQAIQDGLNRIPKK